MPATSPGRARTVVSWTRGIPRRAARPTHPPSDFFPCGAAPHAPARGDQAPSRVARNPARGWRDSPRSAMRPDVVGTWTGTGSLCPSVRGVAQVAPTLDRRMRLGVTQAERARRAIGAAGATAPQGSAESAPVPVWRGSGGEAPTLEKIRGWVGGPSRAQRVLIRSGEAGGYALTVEGSARSSRRGSAASPGAPSSARDAPLARCSAVPPRSSTAPIRPGAWGRSPHREENPRAGGCGPEPRAARSSGRATRRRRRGSARSSGRPYRQWRGRCGGGAPAGSPRRRGSGARPP